MNPLKAVYRWYEYPHRLLALRTVLRRPGATVLDVGCGNHSPALTKKYFPHCVYHGLDCTRWNRDAADDRAMDRFFDIDLEFPERLAALPENAYDAIVCSHVLEHVGQPYAVAEQLVRRLKAGGTMYVECPSPRSRAFPRARDGWCGIRGCLNFYDDPTHRTLVDLGELSARMRRRGYAVGRPRQRSLWRRWLFLPAYVAAGMLCRGYVPASVVWDVTGFAQYVVVRRPCPAGVVPGEEVL